MNRLQEIEKRLAEIKGLIEKEEDTAKLDALQAEVRSLLEEKGKIEGAAIGEARAAFNAAAPGEVKDPTQKSEVEKRAESFISTKHEVIDVRDAMGALNKRALLLSSGAIATPTTVDGVRDNFDKVPAIINDVRVVNKKGSGEYKVAYTKTNLSASKATEGAGATASEYGTGYVDIKPYAIEVYTEVSRKIPSETPLDYEARVRDSALLALRKKVCSLIALGDGSEFLGIANSVDKDGNAMVQAITLSTDIDASTLRKIVLQYAGDDQLDGDATLYLSKATLQKFGDVRGTSEKKAVYDISFTNGTTEGIIKEGGTAARFVIIKDLADKLDYGNPMNYELALFSDYQIEIDTSYKFKEGLDAIKGSVTVGGAVTTQNGFSVISQKAA